MVGLRRIQMSLFLMLLLQIPAAAAARDLLLSLYVRFGEEVTLSCENVLNDQKSCGSTTWLLSISRENTVELIAHGQVHVNAKDKAAKLNVTANCSMVIKKVTVEDVGVYFCQQYKEGKKQGSDSRVYLSLVNVTEDKNAHMVTLTCSVTTSGRCTHSVQWLLQGTRVDPKDQRLMTTQSSCSASVSFLTDHFCCSSTYQKMFTCEVTDGHTAGKHVFPLRRAGETPGKRTITEATAATTAATKSSTETGNITTSAITEAVKDPQDWSWLYIVAAVVLVALLTTVAVTRWKKTRGNKTQMNDNVGLTSNPAGMWSGPETSGDVAHPDEDVSYASISYSKKTGSNSWVQRVNRDYEGDPVTYMTVKASSADPSSLYATINRPE